MRVVCPSCDREPVSDSAAGVACGGCGTPLVEVRTDEDLIGTVVDGRFEIVGKLGQGGMGAVFRAKQRSIGREVALKLMDRRFEGDVAAVKRFLREAKLASQLAHPNTVGVIEFGQGQDGRLYLAMELVRGRTLYDVTKQEGPLPVARVARIGVQLCDALEAAHALSIVHRDLKLEHVMLLDAPAGRDLVKVLDFGLARSFVDPEGRATETGVFAGTPRYLAPEVLEGGSPAPAQDLYALGVLLGELAAGRSLWDAPTMESMLAIKRDGRPTLDGIEPALRALVERLLVRDPAARPAHAEIRATLLGLDVRSPRGNSSLALEPTRQRSVVEVAPANSAAFEPPSASADSAAFAPPGGATVELELELEWRHGKAAKQAATSVPPPRGKLKIFGIVVAVAIIAVVAVVVGIIAHQPPAPTAAGSPGRDGTIAIEIRSSVPAAIRVDGHAVGRAPTTIHVAKRTTPIKIEATIASHPQTRMVVPDRDQTIDFTRLGD